MTDDDEDREVAAEPLPFSHETLATYQKLQRATTKDERLKLTLELAERFAAEYDPADETATDDFHRYFEELAKAKLLHEQAAAKVGRLASECIKQYLSTSNVTLEEAVSETTKTLN